MNDECLQLLGVRSKLAGRDQTMILLVEPADGACSLSHADSVTFNCK